MHIWLANHPPVSIWPERKEREGGRGMWQVHTFHSSWKNTKHYDPMLDVREGQCLYWNKNRLSHNCPHQKIYTHIHGGSTQRIIVRDSSSFDFSLWGAKWVLKILCYMFLSKRLYFQLTIHLFLITDLFFCHAGSNADEPTWVWQIKMNVFSLDQQGSCASRTQI